MSHPSPTVGPSAGRLLGTLYFGFFFTGIMTALLGPLVPIAAAAHHRSAMESGSLFAAQWIAMAIAAIVATRDFRISLNVGYELMAVGAALLGAPHWWMLNMAVAIIGLGLGLVITCSNLLAADIRPTRRAADLSTLNFAWGCGAVLCPVLVSYFSREGVHVLGYVLGAMLIMPAAAVAINKMPRRLSNAISSTPTAGTRPGSTLLVILTTAMVIYVGAETAYSGWVATYTNSVLSNKGAQVTMAFWFGLLLARASAPFVLRAVEPRKLFFAAISAATVFALALLFATTLPTLAIVAFLLGAGIGTLYPLQVSFVAAYAARRGRDVPGWFFALGNLGGALLPAVVGQVGVATGSVRTAMTVPLLALLIVITLQSYAQARLRQA